MTTKNNRKIDIQISEAIRNSCPSFTGAAIFASVCNNEHNISLWNEINQFIKEYKDLHKIEDIKKNFAIVSTREAYKTLGKDPNRYRPSSESLCRRILKEQSLYNVNTLVDLVNLISMQSGYSISGFDSDKIQGNLITLDVGKEDEPYEGIGKGFLNVAYLPIYRDSEGGIGTPTSDNERTKIDIETSQVLIIMNSFSGKDGLPDAVKNMIEALTKYGDAKNIEVRYFPNLKIMKANSSQE